MKEHRTKAPRSWRNVSRSWRRDKKRKATTEARRARSV